MNTQLYTSIPRKLAFMDIEFYLQKYSDNGELLTNYILMVVEYLIQHNYFKFYNSFYLQKTGGSMAAKFLLAIANLYVAWFEEYFYFL